MLEIKNLVVSYGAIAALHGISGQETKLRAGFALETVAMAGRAHDKARDLSGGQMRRVEIARALLHRPRMLLLDEPTAGLDIKARADILKHVRDLVARQNIGVLWATHLIDEIERPRLKYDAEPAQRIARGTVHIEAKNSNGASLCREQAGYQAK